MSAYNLNRLRHFVEVVQRGSFTAAAQSLGLGKAIVSHQVGQLEAELGVTLLVRTTRSLHLTRAGERFYEQAAVLVEQATHAALEAQEEQNVPRGRLVVTAPEDYGRKVVADVLMALRKTYPDLEIDALFTDEKLDLVRERIDASIRVGWLDDSSNLARKIGSFQQYLVASPDYLVASGSIRVPDDVRDKDWIYNRKLSRTVTWLSAKTGAEAGFQINEAATQVLNTATAHSCALAGGGLCVLPSYLVADDLKAGRLDSVLPDWRLPEGGIYVVYPNMRLRPAKVRIFVEALIAAVKNCP